MNTDQSVSAVVRNYTFHARLDRQFFGGEVLLAIDLAVHDPAIDKTFLLRVIQRHRLQIMIVLKVRVHVRFPVELRDDEIQVAVFGLGHVLHEQVPRHITPLDHALIHAKYIAAPLRFIGAKAAGRMEDAWADEPTGSWLQAISFRQVEDAIVSFIPILQAFAHLGFGRARFEAEKCVRKIVADIIMLRREIIALRFAFLAD